MPECLVACPVVSDSLRPYGLACKAPLSIGFFWQNFWSGMPFPPPGQQVSYIKNKQSKLALPDFFHFKAK